MNLMGAGLGFEPRIRTNLVPMTDYKTVRLPLTYPALFIFLITPYIFQ